MDLTALQLAARFSLPPNSLGYCGKNTAPAKFIDCVLNKNTAGVKEELQKFIVLNPYLETLAHITERDPFSYPVVEAYWLGNDELKKSKMKDYNILLENFAKQGVPEWLIADLRQKTPSKFIPVHLWQVLHIGVGRASGSVPYNLETINNCMVRWGEITSLDKNHLKVLLHSLMKKENYYSLSSSEQSFSYRADFLPNLTSGDTVAVHWQQVVKKLTTEEISHLEYWTHEVIATLKE